MYRSNSMRVFAFVAFILVIGQQVSALQPSPKIDDHSKHSSNYEANYKPNKKSFKDDYDKHEPEERIQFSEPYKSLVQTTARFALSQWGVAKVVDVETTMDIINDTSFMLSKPSVLTKFAKGLAVVLAILFPAVFFFPGAPKYIEAAWRDPAKILQSLERYLPNGINEKAVLSLLGAKKEVLLSTLGLADSSCREQSVCQMGEIMRCASPNLADAMNKFITDHFPSRRYRENKYINAFFQGFADQSCWKLAKNDTDPKKSCIGDLFGSYFKQRCDLSPRDHVNKQKLDYQTIQAGRA